MEWLVFIGICVVLIWWGLTPSKKPPASPPQRKYALIDDDVNAKLEKATRRGNEFLAELIPLRRLRKELVARNEALEARIDLALEIIPLIDPPDWIDVYVLFPVVEKQQENYPQTCHAWAARAVQTWTSVDALSTDSRRSLEEACWATLRDGTSAAYTATPLLSDTVKLLETMPKVITVNPFELTSGDFQKFALWLDIVERMGSNYWQLRSRAANLVPLPPRPSDALAPELEEEVD